LPEYLQNVTCQACHGPGSLHEIAPFNEKMQTIGLVMNASLCGSCHTGKVGGTHHPTYDEWNLSGHAEIGLPDYIKNNVQCANCHESWMAAKMLETGAFRTSYRIGSEDAPLTWQIGCPTCHDPHSVGANGIAQLRVDETQICQRCHNAYGANYTSEPGTAPHHPMAEMRNNTAGFGVDRSQTSYMNGVYCFSCHMGVERAGLPNHTFMPNARHASYVTTRLD
jgi:predicted CXXCH cytochrome family protein